MHVLLLCSVLLASDEAAPSAVIASLRTAVEQWQDEVTFRSTFRLRYGFAQSVSAGLRDGVDPSIRGSPTQVFEGTGSYRKKGRLSRYSMDYGHPSVDLDASLSSTKSLNLASGQRAAADVGFDEVTDGVFQIRYNPERSINHAQVDSREPRDSGVGRMSRNFLSPLNPTGNAEHDLFRFFSVNPELDAQTGRSQVGSLDADRIEVVFSREAGQWKQVRRLHFLSAASPPVLASLDEVTTKGSDVVTESHARLSDFRDCPGGKVARKVLYVFRARSGGVYVREWTSDDLGAVPPSDADFVVSVAPDTRVRGLKNPPAEGASDRVLDITKLTDADLGSPPLPVAQSEKKPTPASRRRFLPWASVGLLVAGAIVLVIRSRSRIRHT